MVPPLPCEKEVMLTMANAQATIAVGERLGRAALPGTLILLSGELGSGKTALTQGLARGLAITEVVNSPTFTLLKEYHSGRLPLYHFDLYRIDDPGELWALGFTDYFSGVGVCVVEWAERAPDMWGDVWLWITIAVLGTSTRQLQACARGTPAQALLAKMRLGRAKQGH